MGCSWKMSRLPPMEQQREQRGRGPCWQTSVDEARDLAPHLWHLFILMNISGSQLTLGNRKYTYTIKFTPRKLTKLSKWDMGNIGNNQIKLYSRPGVDNPVLREPLASRFFCPTRSRASKRTRVPVVYPVGRKTLLDRGSRRVPPPVLG